MERFCDDMYHSFYYKYMYNIYVYCTYIYDKVEKKDEVGLSGYKAL